MMIKNARVSSTRAISTQAWVGQKINFEGFLFGMISFRQFELTVRSILVAKDRYVRRGSSKEAPSLFAGSQCNGIVHVHSSPFHLANKVTLTIHTSSPHTHYSIILSNGWKLCCSDIDYQHTHFVGGVCLKKRR